MAKRLKKLVGDLGSTNLGYMGKWMGLAGLIGFIVGLVTVGFAHLIQFMRQITVHHFTGTSAEGLGGVPEETSFWVYLERVWPLLVILPIGGFVVGWCIRYYASEAEGSGTEQVIHTFHELKGRVRKRVFFLKAALSAITVGTGGSAGQEGPIAQIGASVGANVSTGLNLSDRDRRIFLLAGASAGVGALFTAPLAGALFAPEVLYRKPEFEGDAIIPCIISSIVSYTTFSTITGHDKVIHIAEGVQSHLALNDPRELLVYLALAIVCTLGSFLYVRSAEITERVFSVIRGRWRPLRSALGAFLVGVIAIGLGYGAGDQGILYGGYQLMAGSIASQMSIGLMVVLVLAKIVGTSLTLSSGGSGGDFAPSLAVGAMLGAIVGQTAAAWFPALELFPGCYALVGMGGFFAGIANVPITAIIVVCEMTGSYGLLAPLMLVAVLHVMLSRSWTIYPTQVNGPAESPAHSGDYVIDVLEQLRVSEVVDFDQEVPRVSQNATLRKALEIVSHASGTYFPVVNAEDQMVGIFSLSDIRRLFGETDVQDLVIVRDFMVEEVASVRRDDTLNDALSLMNKLAIHQIPVTSDTGGRHVVAMLTRNNVGAAYHQRMRELGKRQ